MTEDLLLANILRDWSGMDRRPDLQVALLLRLSADVAGTSASDIPSKVADSMAWEAAENMGRFDEATEDQRYDIAQDLLFDAQAEVRRVAEGQKEWVR